MLETLETDLADATKSEEASVANFDALVAAKEAEIDAATKAVEDKLTRVGNHGVEISTMKEDLDDTAKAMLEDKKFLAELEKGCATKQGEWDERCKTRTEELLALADTIKSPKRSCKKPHPELCLSHMISFSFTHRCALAQISSSLKFSQQSRAWHAGKPLQHWHSWHRRCLS